MSSLLPAPQMLTAPPPFPEITETRTANVPLSAGKVSGSQGALGETRASGDDQDNAVRALSFSQSSGSATKGPGAMVSGGIRGSSGSSSGEGNDSVPAGSLKPLPEMDASLANDTSRNGVGGDDPAVALFDKDSKCSASTTKSTVSATNWIDRHRAVRAMQSASTKPNRSTSRALSAFQADIDSSEGAGSGGSVGSTSTPPPFRSPPRDSPRSLDFQKVLTGAEAGIRSSRSTSNDGSERDEGDEGSNADLTGVDEEEYTWFPSERRGGRVVYDRVRINDFAQVCIERKTVGEGIMLASE